MINIESNKLIELDFVLTFSNEISNIYILVCQDMNMQRNGWGGGPMMGGVGPMMGVGGGPMMDSPMVHPLMNRMGEQKKTSSNRIKVLFDPSVKKTTLEKIFNIVPGFVSLEFIEMVTKGAVAGVTYDNPLSAQHAIERIQVRFIDYSASNFHLKTIEFTY